MVGYSRLVGQNEEATLAGLRTLRREVIDRLLRDHRGRITKLMGDGALAEFGSVVDAVACAIAVQTGVSFHQANDAPDQRIVFRIGINLGDVVVDGDDLLGDGVNVATGYRGRPVDPRQVGRDLKIRYVLEGSLQRQADQLRINTQLVEMYKHGSRRSHREHYDRKIKEFFEIQSEIADRIVATVSGYRGLVKVADTNAMRRKAPDKLDAYELYLLAQDISYGLTKANLEERFNTT